MLRRLSPRSGLWLALLVAAMIAKPVAAAPWSGDLEQGLAATRGMAEDLGAKAEWAIIAGAVLVYRHRHAIAGATLGCAAGATLGASSAVGASLATGGASLGGIGAGAALGCGLGALSGAAMGRQLDDPYEPR